MVGADPEFPIFNTKSGLSVPAHLFGYPHKETPIMMNTGYLLRDGWNIEANPMPATCREAFIRNVWSQLSHIEKSLKKGYEIRLLPAFRIDRSLLDTAPPDVKILGCDKAWNAYTQKQEGPGEVLADSEWRTAGGHMHIGFTACHPSAWMRERPAAFLWARMADRLVGLLNTYLLGSEEAGERRKYYGQAGEFRFQPHGLEYRVPGPELFGNQVLISLHFGILRYLTMYYPKFVEHYSPKHEAQVRKAINAGVSNPDLLDLIVDLPYWYTKPILKKARRIFQKTKHSTPALSPVWDGITGWDHWLRNEGGLMVWHVEERNGRGHLYGTGY